MNCGLDRVISAQIPRRVLGGLVQRGIRQTVDAGSLGSENHSIFWVSGLSGGDFASMAAKWKTNKSLKDWSFSLALEIG